MAGEMAMEVNDAMEQPARIDAILMPVRFSCECRCAC
jgi:hypothetical protein